MSNARAWTGSCDRRTSGLASVLVRFTGDACRFANEVVEASVIRVDEQAHKND